MKSDVVFLNARKPNFEYAIWVFAALYTALELMLDLWVPFLTIRAFDRLLSCCDDLHVLALQGCGLR